MAGKLWVVVRRPNGRFIRRIEARSAEHARRLTVELDRTYPPSYTIKTESVTG